MDRLTDEQVKAVTTAMRTKQAALKMGTVEIDRLEALALQGDQGARFVICSAWRKGLGR